MIYILKHPDSKFSGIFFGIGFENGVGSTSSQIDRDRLVKAGCKDITSPEEKSAAKKKSTVKKAAAEKAPEKTEKG